MKVAIIGSRSLAVTQTELENYLPKETDNGLYFIIK